MWGVGWRTGRFGDLGRIEGRRSLALGLVSSYICLSEWSAAFWGVSSDVGGAGGGGRWGWMVRPPIRPCGPLLLGSRCMYLTRTLYKFVRAHTVLWGLVCAVVLCVGVRGCMYIPAFVPAFPPLLLVPQS